MRDEKKDTSPWIIRTFLAIMGIMILGGALFPERIARILYKPEWYSHILFIHILSVSLFFTNGVIGMIWEARSLFSRKREIILYTYHTVSWLDARLSSPLIVLSVLSGIMLTVQLGDIRDIGWLMWAFVLFILSGVIWVITDIPTQYRIQQKLKALEPDQEKIPPEVMGLLKKRLWISLGGMLPLLVVFILMVYKPGLPSL